jgi:hypothetical protein
MFAYRTNFSTINGKDVCGTARFCGPRTVRGDDDRIVRIPSRAPQRLTGERDQIQTRTGFTFTRHGLAFKRRKARRMTGTVRGDPASRTGNSSVTGRGSAVVSPSAARHAV